MSRKIILKKRKSSSNDFKLELGLSGLIYLGIFIILGMTWAFILGVYIGRGYKPEDVVPQIATIMPETKTRPNRSPSNTVKQEILKPEQLEFYDKLKKQAQQGGHTNATADKATFSNKIKRQPETRRKKNLPKKAKVKFKKQDKKIKTTPTNTKQKIFSYTYQVAAFRTLNQATKMQEALVKQGFMSSISKAFSSSKPWFRVFVHFQGTPEQVKELKNKLKKIGIKQPILKRKKPL